MRAAFTFIELASVSAVTAVVFVIAISSIAAARERARNAQCVNNLRNLTIALNAYHDAAGRFPPGTTGARSPVSLDQSEHHVSWIVRITPQLGRTPLYDAYDFGATAYEQVGTAAGFNLLYCPSGDFHSRDSSYVGFHAHVPGPITDAGTGLLFLNSSVRRGGIADGAGCTLALTETTLPWPVDWTTGTRATLRTPEFAGAEELPWGAYDAKGSAWFDLRERTDDLGFDPCFESGTVDGPLPPPEPVSLTEADLPSWSADFAVRSIGSRHTDGHVNAATAGGAVRPLSPSIDRGLLRSLVHRSDAAPLEGF